MHGWLGRYGGCDEWWGGGHSSGRASLKRVPESLRNCLHGVRWHKAQNNPPTRTTTSSSHTPLLHPEIISFPLPSTATQVRYPWQPPNTGVQMRVRAAEEAGERSAMAPLPYLAQLVRLLCRASIFSLRARQANVTFLSGRLTVKKMLITEQIQLRSLTKMSTNNLNTTICPAFSRTWVECFL